MSIMIDTPDGIAFVKACSRQAALSLEIKGLKRSSGRQTAYSIVKQVYGFRGSRESVLADLSEYIECEHRIREMKDEDYELCKKVTQSTIDYFGDKLTQSLFEGYIARAEARGVISNGVRQGASDIFYVMIVRSNAGGR